jgi:hypothetical protein
VDWAFCEAAVAEQIVTGVVPPADRASDSQVLSRTGVGRALPVAVLARLRDVPRVYGMARVDSSGRVCDRSIVRALGWQAGHRLAVNVVGDAVVFRPDPRAVLVMPSKRYVPIPAAARVRCGIGAGDRVLLVAEVDQSVLVVYSLWAVDGLLAQHHAAVIGGDTA